MGASKELIAAVEGKANQHLADLGFTRRRNVHTKEVAPEVLGWIGLNRAVRRGDDQLLVNPVIGVRHQGLEREVARLVGERFHPYQPPSISAPLSQLAGTGDYLFKEGRRNKLDRQVERMIDTVAAHAIPFLKSHASLEGLISAMRSGRFGIPDEVVYRLPVALALDARDGEAAEQLRASLAELGHRDDPAARRLRVFAEAFMNAPTSPEAVRR